MRRVFAVLAVAVLVLTVSVVVCSGQGSKALSKPGTKAGQQALGPDGGTYVWVPAGKFVMGSVNGKGHPDEWPLHQVHITKGFWLGKYTVTLGQWKAYCLKLHRKVGWPSAPGDKYPLVDVSWIEAAAYCKYYGLSLPTEAQWEYAARGKADTIYPWGNKWDKSKCCNAAHKGPSGSTFPVGSFPAGVSWCGAMDMAGSVWEACQDWYGADYYLNSPADDPTGPKTGNVHVVRGGSWKDGADLCRSEARDDLVGPEAHFDTHGFRCVKVP